MSKGNGQISGGHTCDGCPALVILDQVGGETLVFRREEGENKVLVANALEMTEEMLAPVCRENLPKCRAWSYRR